MALGIFQCRIPFLGLEILGFKSRNQCYFFGSIENPDRWPNLIKPCQNNQQKDPEDYLGGQYRARYNLSSRMSDAAQFNRLVRSNRSIENRLKGVLNVTFREDSARKREGKSALNFNLITKIAIRILL